MGIEEQFAELSFCCVKDHERLTKLEAQFGAFREWQSDIGKNYTRYWNQVQSIESRLFAMNAKLKMLEDFHIDDTCLSDEERGLNADEKLETICMILGNMTKKLDTLLAEKPKGDLDALGKRLKEVGKNMLDDMKFKNSMLDAKLDPRPHAGWLFTPQSDEPVYQDPAPSLSALAIQMEHVLKQLRRVPTDDK